MNLKLCKRFFSVSAEKALNHEAFLTKTAANRMPSPIRELAPFLQQPEMISLAGGAPNASTFPFKSLSFDVPSISSVLSNSCDALDTLSLSPKELDIALQYAPSKGIQPLYEYLKKFHNDVHRMPYQDWDICISTGSQDLITRVFDAVLADGDSIVIEAPTYCGSLSFLKARKDVNVISVNMDENGMIADELDIALSENERVKMIYTIPIGQNPSGSSYSSERKKQIYDIACKHNVLLLEDDPYYFLDFDHMDYSKPRATSFQSIDVESRVIRTDSFSKILSSGIRLGYMTAHSSIIRNIELNLQATCLQTSSLTQMAVFKLLEHWNSSDFDEHEIFQKHLSNVCGFYLQQKNMMNKILETYLKDKCKWIVPSGGMFFWMQTCKEDTNSLIKEKAKNANVLLLPGNAFYADERAIKNPYVRASYSIATEQDMEEGIKRFAALL